MSVHFFEEFLLIFCTFDISRVIFEFNYLKSMHFFLDFQDDFGTHADSERNPVIQALPILRQLFPNLLIACDVCLCPYTGHGHCGILESDGVLNNKQSIKRIAQIAMSYAKSGAHIGTISLQNVFNCYVCFTLNILQLLLPT